MHLIVGLRKKFFFQNNTSELKFNTFSWVCVKNLSNVPPRDSGAKTWQSCYVKHQETHMKSTTSNVFNQLRQVIFFVLWPEATKEKLVLIISQSMCHFPVVI